MSEMTEELALKSEELEAVKIENNRRYEEMKQWQFAVSEMKAVHLELQTLDQQVIYEIYSIDPLEQ